MNKEFENFLKSQEPEFIKYQDNIMNKAKSILETCYNNAHEDIERFADCVEKSSKKLSRVSKRIENKLAFFNFRVNECFDNKTVQGSKDYSECHTLGSSLLQKVFDNPLDRM
jgi:excinuclease UvrABC nuclease subunit